MTLERERQLCHWKPAEAAHRVHELETEHIKQDKVITLLRQQLEEQVTSPAQSNCNNDKENTKINTKDNNKQTTIVIIVYFDVLLILLYITKLHPDTIFRIRI